MCNFLTSNLSTILLLYFSNKKFLKIPSMPLSVFATSPETGSGWFSLSNFLSMSEEGRLPFSMLLNDMAKIFHPTVGFLVLHATSNHFYDPMHDLQKLRGMLWYFCGLAHPLSWGFLLSEFFTILHLQRQELELWQIISQRFKPQHTSNSWNKKPSHQGQPLDNPKCKPHTPK